MEIRPPLAAVPAAAFERSKYGVTLYPSPHRDVIGVQAPLDEQLLHITVGKREAQVPADRKHDHLRFKLTPLEQSGNRWDTEHPSILAARLSGQASKVATLPDGAEALESGQNALWGGQDGDRVRGKACAGSVAGFELATEDEGGVGELFFWQAELGAKEDLGRPASGEGHDCHAQSGVAPGVQQLCGGGDEGLRVEGNQIGLLLVDLLVVGAFELVSGEVELDGRSRNALMRCWTLGTGRSWGCFKGGI
jgi:hypothetical protein